MRSLLTYSLSNHGLIVYLYVNIQVLCSAYINSNARLAIISLIIPRFTLILACFSTGGFLVLLPY
jgi:hypothetical protein